MGYRFVDHTAELQLELEAPTKEEVLAQAVLALGELLGARESEGAGSPVTRSLAVTAGDDAALLAAWIDEIVFVAESEALVPLGAEGIETAEGEARGTVVFARKEPPHLVKGVTYHDLALAPAGIGWRGRAVLDV